MHLYLAYSLYFNFSMVHFSPSVIFFFFLKKKSRTKVNKGAPKIVQIVKFNPEGTRGPIRLRMVPLFLSFLRLYYSVDKIVDTWSSKFDLKFDLIANRTESERRRRKCAESFTSRKSSSKSKICAVSSNVTSRTTSQTKSRTNCASHHWSHHITLIFNGLVYCTKSSIN